MIKKLRYLAYGMALIFCSGIAVAEFPPPDTPAEAEVSAPADFDGYNYACKLDYDVDRKTDWHRERSQAQGFCDLLGRFAASARQQHEQRDPARPW